MTLIPARPVYRAVLILKGIFDLVLVFILRRKCLIVLVTFESLSQVYLFKIFCWLTLMTQIIRNTVPLRRKLCM